jgi:hypothetical protein
MRPWEPDHTQDDPSRDPEIDRWFRALGPPPVGHVPPNLHAKVRARIAQQQSRWAVFRWRPRVVSPAWAVALAVGLVLSIGLNVWWSVRTLGLISPRANQSADSLLHDLGVAGSLPTYQFQISMQRAKALGTFVAAHSVRHPPVVVGFTPQAGRTTFFHMGTLYAEALATLHSGAGEATTQRLDVLVQTLASVQAPRVLSDYLREMLSLVQRRPHEGEVLATFLALFEPLYGDVYARNNEALMLFRTGAWLENMYLASAAGDRTALQQGGQAVEAFHSALMQLHAPPAATEALERLHLLTTRQTLTDQDVGTITTLVQDIQRVLSD